jgi:hypothetical protein
MKRALASTLFLCVAAVLGGCPIYGHEDEGCYRDRDCAPGYYCEDRKGDCVAEAAAPTCSRPADCSGSQTCSSRGVCESGDCTFNGCVSGYVCGANAGVWQCIARSAPNGSAGAAGESGAGSTEPGVAGAGGMSGSAGSAEAGTAGTSEGGSSGAATN